MLLDFFYKLRDAGIPVSVKEYLTLLEAMKSGFMTPGMDNFYYLSKMSLVKDERFFDRFDKVFGSYFKGLEGLADIFAQLPKDWLEKRFHREFTAEEKAAIQAMGGLDKLMERLKQLLEEQKERHEGGNKWIGSGGTSPFGNNGYNPEGIRIGQDNSRNRSAVKIWDQRHFQDYDDQLEIGTRNIKVALRRLRRFAREGAQEELDLDDTIASTARNAGYLDLKMRPERHNSVKVLMLLDVGGSMDDHIRRTEELFSAASSEFKHLGFYYFHNCVYDFLWKKNHRRHSERFHSIDILHKYNADYRLIFVGDATMSPYEILQPGGSVEYYNEEAGALWMRRFLDRFPKAVWLNPEPEGLWKYRQSVEIMQKIMDDRMYPLTIKGLEVAMRYLSK